MDLTATLKRFSDAVEAGDGEALASLFAPDGIYDDYFFGPQKGRAAIKEMLAHFYDGGRDFRWDFFDCIQQGSLGYASYRFSYTSKAPEAEGARVTFDGIGRIVIEGDHIKTYNEVFDRGMALAQQNYAPERIRRIGQKFATALKARPEWARHST
jgi:ketosteroid isomerase-like protein